MSVEIPIIEEKKPRGNVPPDALPKFHAGDPTTQPPTRYENYVFTGNELLPLCICECGNWIATRTRKNINQSNKPSKTRRVHFKCDYANEKWHKGIYNDTYVVLLPESWADVGEEK